MRFFGSLCALALAGLTPGCAWLNPAVYEAQAPDPRPLGAQLPGAEPPRHQIGGPGDRPAQSTAPPQAPSAPKVVTLHQALTLALRQHPDLAGAEPPRHQIGGPGDRPAQSTAPPQAPSAPKVVTLHQALTLALRQHPDLVSAAHELSAREAEAIQAGLPPNPEFETELENILGGDKTQQDVSGLKGAEATILISQVIELGGKRSRRRRAAELDADLARWDYEARRLDLIGRVHRTFVALLAAQQRAALVDEFHEIARRANETALQRVEAGKVSPLEAQRTGIAISQLAAERDRAIATVMGLRHALASFWGSSEPQFERVEGTLDALPRVPAFETVNQLLEANPELARWQSELALRRARLELARAQAIPDPRLGVGARYWNETDNHAFLIGFSIPIPLFDRNQGNIAAARQRLEQASAQHAAARQQLIRRLAQAHGSLKAAEDAAQRLRRETLPLARQTYEESLEGYRLGKFDLTAVLDAQRALMDVRTRHLDALADYHATLAEIESLIGRPLTSIQKTNSTREGVAQ